MYPEFEISQHQRARIVMCLDLPEANQSLDNQSVTTDKICSPTNFSYLDYPRTDLQAWKPVLLEKPGNFPIEYSKKTKINLYTCSIRPYGLNSTQNDTVGTTIDAYSKSPTWNNIAMWKIKTNLPQSFRYQLSWVLRGKLSREWAQVFGFDWSLLRFRSQAGETGGPLDHGTRGGRKFDVRRLQVRFTLLRLVPNLERNVKQESFPRLDSSNAVKNDHMES